MDVGAYNCIWIFVTQGIVRSVSNTFALSVKTCLFYFVVGGIFTLVRLTSGALSQCLNFGPSSEPWVISGVCFSLFFPFPFILF